MKHGARAVLGHPGVGEDVERRRSVVGVFFQQLVDLKREGGKEEGEVVSAYGTG